MPRKINPRWGEDGYEDVELFRLKAGQTEELAAMLGFASDAPQVSDIRFAVEDIGTIYRNWHGRGASAFTRAEARKALEEILRVDRIDCAAITSLNERANQCVHNALLLMVPAPVRHGDTVMAALVENRLDEEVIRNAVRNAIKRLNATKGPDREGDVAWAVAQFCELYENLTDQAATHSNKAKHLAYESGPLSKAGRFVKACFKLIDPQLRDSQISQGIRHFIERRK